MLYVFALYKLNGCISSVLLMCYGVYITVGIFDKRSLVGKKTAWCAPSNTM